MGRLSSPVTLSVGQASHDGYSPWSSRAASSATLLVNEGTAGAVNPVGPHLSATPSAGALVYARYFIFRFGDGSPNSGIPQGRQIDSAKLRLHSGNTNTAGNTRIYLAVENNLDPTGVGAITNGTLGSQPWQRLTRRSAATTLLGNRCGPTHAHPSGLSGYNSTGIRDTNSLIYKAFADGRAIPAAAWFETDNFAGALQPLVNDPGWDPDSQYVLVWWFSDANVTAGTDGGGRLDSIAWASGQTGSTDTYVNSGGQVRHWDYLSGSTPPSIVVAHQSATSRETIGSQSGEGGSISGGAARVFPLPCFARWRGENLTGGSSATFAPAQTGGAQDLPPNYGNNIGNPNTAISLLSHDAPRTGRTGRSLLLEDFASTAPKWGWDVDYWQDQWDSLNVYSGRYYWQPQDGSWVGLFPAHLRFYLGGTFVWGVEFDDYTSDFVAAYPRIFWTGGNTAYATYPLSNVAVGSDWIRWEVQVDGNRDPKVRIRLYENDGITPVATLTANPPSVEADRLVYGDDITGFFTCGAKYHDVEWWAGYSLDRQFQDPVLTDTGTPYEPPTWQWFDWDGDETFAELDDLGTIASVDPDGSNVVLTDPTDPIVDEIDNREHWFGSTDPVTVEYLNVPYGTGYRRLDIYTPVGDPPPGGWPVFQWTHGGYWNSGTRGQVPDTLVAWLNYHGWAVVSHTYALTAVTLSGQTYPAWSAANVQTGRYQSIVLDAKMAGAWIESDGAAYGLDGTRKVIGGFSAGHWAGMMAALSRELDNDGSGRSLRLANAGNRSTYLTPNVPDPVYLGTYGWCGPVNPASLAEYDPSTPDYPLLENKGNITIAVVFLCAQAANTSYLPAATNMGVDDALSRIDAQYLVPTVYSYGDSDWTVPGYHPTNPDYSQAQRLADAFAARGRSDLYEAIAAVGTYHDVGAEEFDPPHLRDWLAERLTEA